MKIAYLQGVSYPFISLPMDMFNRSRSKESIEMHIKHNKTPKIKSLSDFKKVFILSRPYFAATIYSDKRRHSLRWKMVGGLPATYKIQ